MDSYSWNAPDNHIEPREKPVLERMGFLRFGFHLPRWQVDLFGYFIVEDGCQFTIRKFDVILSLFIRPDLDDQTASPIHQFHVGIFVQTSHLLGKSTLRHSLHHMMQDITLHADCLFRCEHCFFLEGIFLSLL